MIYNKKKETEGKIYSPFGKFSERAKLITFLLWLILWWKKTYEMLNREVDGRINKDDEAVNLLATVRGEELLPLNTTVKDYKVKKK